MGKYVLVDFYSPLHFLSHIFLKTADTQLLNIDFLSVDSFWALKNAVFQLSTRARWLNCTPNQPTRGEEGQWNPARVAGKLKWVGGNDTHQLLGKRQNVRMSRPLDLFWGKPRTLIARQRNTFEATCFVSKAPPNTIKLRSNDDMGRAPWRKGSERPLKGVFQTVRARSFLEGSAQQGQVGHCMSFLDSCLGLLLEFLILMRRPPLPGCKKIWEYAATRQSNIK